jgi:hypothetical protein
VGALRREEAAARALKQLQAELETAQDLGKQRDMDAQRTKMIIRLKEDKIARLQACAYPPFGTLVHASHACMLGSLAADFLKSMASMYCENLFMAAFPCLSLHDFRN